MKSFLEGRQSISGGRSQQGKITKGAEFQALAAGVGGNASSSPATAEDVQELPNDDPNAPKVEYIRDGETIRRIIVSFGEHRVEIDCQY